MPESFSERFPELAPYGDPAPRPALKDIEGWEEDLHAERRPRRREWWWIHPSAAHLARTESWLKQELRRERAWEAMLLREAKRSPEMEVRQLGGQITKLIKVGWRYLAVED